MRKQSLHDRINFKSQIPFTAQYSNRLLFTSQIHKHNPHAPNRTIPPNEVLRIQPSTRVSRTPALSFLLPVRNEHNPGNKPANYLLRRSGIHMRGAGLDNPGTPRITVDSPGGRGIETSPLSCGRAGKPCAISAFGNPGSSIWVGIVAFFFFPSFAVEPGDKRGGDMRVKGNDDNECLYCTCCTASS